MPESRVQHIDSLLSWLIEQHSSTEAVFFDIDGTLIRGHDHLPGARELLAWLDECRIPYLLLTNDANHSHEQKAAKLRRAGLEIPPAHIVSSGDVLAEIASERSLTGKRFFVMGELGRPNYAELAGLAVTRDRAELPECEGVIVGEENYDWEPTFNAVINYFIKKPAAPFIVPNPDSYWPNRGPGISIGAGGAARFVCSILDAYGVKVEPLFLGKPFPSVFTYALEVLESTFGVEITKRRRVLMAGDSLSGDIRGANGAGFTSVLVLTGITPERALIDGKVDAGSRPDLVARKL